PFLVAHFVATRVKPHHIFDLASPDSSALEKLRSTKNGMIAPELNHFPGELEQRLLFFVAFLPIEPADLVVLTIGIVIAVLSPAEFISPAKHRHTLRNEQRGEKITPLSFPQRIYLWIIGRPFDSMIP